MIRICLVFRALCLFGSGYISLGIPDLQEEAIASLQLSDY
ncbi:hypothetical protein KsCSTR_04150 [Candidatus Kuenenia stuttgartiensis]|uniref:Uncharacterized protein n=1 Tax=Kuenenia stuttgartiensis TaxID=174633 RepID=A0A6G7GKB7_KUEST|nr:hypothetical protein KsCSTR_04150 [Candidatus Kuenenia stuttgartiensis]